MQSNNALICIQENNKILQDFIYDLLGIYNKSKRDLGQLDLKYIRANGDEMRKLEF